MRSYAFLLRINTHKLDSLLAKLNIVSIVFLESLPPKYKDLYLFIFFAAKTNPFWQVAAGTDSPPQTPALPSGTDVFLVNPFSPKTDQHQVSPCIMYAL